jgi:hypothetical protein
VINKNEEHASAGELAGLPGMPSTERGVRKRAADQEWPSRQRAGRGGGREYPISCLPAETQAALAERALSAVPATGEQSPSSCLPAAGALFSSTRGTRGAEGGSAAGETGARPAYPSASGSNPDPRSESLAEAFDAKPDTLKAEARLRLAIVQEYHRLRALGFDRAAVAAAVTREREISEATLWRHLGLVKGEPEHLWLYLLVPGHHGRTATAAMSAEAWEFLKAEYLAPERRSAAACIDRLRRAAPGRGWKIPSNRTLLRRIEQIPRSVRVLARDGRKAALQLYPAQQRVRAALAALSIVNADGYKHNVWVVDEDTGVVFRPHTWVWQDVFSSKVLAWRTDETEHTGQIQLAFGDACERFGIPDAVLVDNTLAAANKTMSGGIPHRFRFKVRPEEPLGVFALFNLEVHWATPGHGQAKPVERAFGIGGLGEYVDKAPECARAWAGSSTSDKPEYDGSKKPVPLKVFKAVLEREVAAFNARLSRRSPIARGRSFDAVFAESYARLVVRRPSEAQRRLWLLSTEEVPVRRDGTIVLDAGRLVGEQRANRYWAADLVDLAGRKVVARFDPQELHKGVHVYTADGRYLCFAECVDPAAFNDQAAAREHARNRRTFIKAARVQLQAERRMDELATSRLLAGAQGPGGAAPAIKAPKVVRPEFRHPLERPRIHPRALDADEQRYMAQLEAEGAAPLQVNVHELRSDTDKHAYWTTLDARRAAGETLADRDEDFWRHWPQSPYFLNQKWADEEFERQLASRRANAKPTG